MYVCYTILDHEAQAKAFNSSKNHVLKLNIIDYKFRISFSPSLYPPLGMQLWVWLDCDCLSKA